MSLIMPIGDGCIDYGGCQCPRFWWGTVPPYCPIHNPHTPLPYTYPTSTATITWPPKADLVRLADEDVERIAQRVAELLKPKRARKKKS